MILLLLCRLAMAHGGVDDEPAAAPTAASSPNSANLAVASKAFEGVVRVGRGPENTPVPVMLLLADYASSAPIARATASMTLTGPGGVQIDLSASPNPGFYGATMTFPTYGEYAGALVVTTPQRSDLMAITGLRIDAGGAPPAAPSGLGWAAILGAGVLAGGVGLVGLGVGYALGRRRGAAAAAALMVLSAPDPKAWAHGGVDDERPASTVTTAAAPGGAVALPMESQFLLGLRTEMLVMAPFQDASPALGRFISRPGDSATLRAPGAGVLVAPPGGFPAPGKAVKAGDLLAILKETPGSADRSALAAQRGDAAVAVAEAKRALALAERDATQVASLGDSLSERERLERQQSVEVAREALRSAQDTLAAMGAGVSIPIRAPLAGSLGSATARPGDQVEAGDPLFRVVDPAGLWMEARVPEAAAMGLTEGAEAEVFASAAPDHRLHAVVLDAGQEADPATGTVLVTLAMDDEHLGLRPGMTATAWIGRGAARDTLVVSDAAVIDSNGSTLAFVKTGPESFEMRALKLGGRAGDTWAVLAGLHPGERVVTDGTSALRSLAGR